MEKTPRVFIKKKIKMFTIIFTRQDVHIINYINYNNINYGIYSIVYKYNIIQKQ